MQQQPQPSREFLLKQWDDSWTTGLWCPPWSRALDDLPPEQAAWRPAPDRHSIWQLVHHVIFWREQATAAIRSVAAAGADEVARRNWESPAHITADAWADARRRLRAAHDLVRTAISASGEGYAGIANLAAHDSYHLGQIMQLRAMQGLAPIE